jgi:hypothetical protein
LSSLLAICLLPAVALNFADDAAVDDDSVATQLAANESPLHAAVPYPGSVSFSATYRYRHQPSDTLLDEARLLVSDTGLRVEQLFNGAANTFIANYATDQFWFLDRQRQLVHEIPVVAVPASDQQTIGQESAGMAGYVQYLPCIGLQARLDGTENWHGRVVQRWSCLLKNDVTENGAGNAAAGSVAEAFTPEFAADVVETQWYAESPGVVLRSLSVDGFLSELVDIRECDLSVDNFRPPSDYRNVSIEELINPLMPISSYYESAGGLH